MTTHGSAPMAQRRRIGRIEYKGALVTAEAFLCLAGLSVVAAGLFLAAAIGEHQAASALGAAWCTASAMTAAFFGYVLKILVGIFEQTWEARLDAAPDDEG